MAVENEQVEQTELPTEEERKLCPCLKTCRPEEGYHYKNCKCTFEHPVDEYPPEEVLIEGPTVELIAEPAPTYRRSEKLDKLAAALAKAQGVFEPAKMSGYNKHFDSGYPTQSDVILAAKSGLAENELSLVQLPQVVGSDVVVTSLLLHSSDQFIETTMTMPINSKTGRPTAHEVKSAVTYACRTSRSAILGISTEDDDGNAATGKGN